MVLVVVVVYNFPFISFRKAIRVVDWVKRFIHNVQCEQSQQRFGDLEFGELKSAKCCLIKCVQAEHYAADIALLSANKPVASSLNIAKLTPFIASDGIWSSPKSTMEYGTKHPIILQKGHLSLLVVIFQHLLLKHAGFEIITGYRYEDAGQTIEKRLSLIAKHGKLIDK